MAYSNHTSAVLLLALLLFATANPSAYGFITPLNGASVTGQLCCTSSGNCPGPSLSNVTVSLNCTVLGAVVNVGQNTTNINGFFNITARTLPGLVLGQPILPCYVGVILPLNSTLCPVLSTVNGTLVSAVRSVNTLVTSILGLVQNATITVFFNVRL